MFNKTRKNTTKAQQPNYFEPVEIIKIQQNPNTKQWEKVHAETIDPQVDNLWKELEKQ